MQRTRTLKLPATAPRINLNPILINVYRVEWEKARELCHAAGLPPTKYERTLPWPKLASEAKKFAESSELFHHFMLDFSWIASTHKKTSIKRAILRDLANEWMSYIKFRIEGFIDESLGARDSSAAIFHRREEARP